MRAPSLSEVWKNTVFETAFIVVVVVVVSDQTADGPFQSFQIISAKVVTLSSEFEYLPTLYTPPPTPYPTIPSTHEKVNTKKYTHQ